MTKTPEQDASFWETFKYGEPAEDADMKVAILDPCASVWVDVNECRNWRLEKWWDYRGHERASAGMVTVPVELLKTAFNYCEAVYHAIGEDAARQASNEIDAILRQAQEIDHE